MVRDQNGCQAYKTFTILEPDELTIDMEDQKIVTPGAAVSINPAVASEQRIEEYQWTPSIGLDCDDCLQPEASPDTTTVYTLTAISEDSCTVSSEIEVKVRSSNEVFVPNAFSPNEDGVNDELRILDYGSLDQVTFQVFNRWGELVFETNDPNATWHGTRNGEKLRSGVYVYYLEGTLIDDSEIEQQGSITIIR
ncbi:MAG: hypothetical protein BRD50_07760 [Bacteroidetes bacterium SW_11_45_7]|nr:MAG: hypothetical protein BRD50_07760 [Bacteroidetes bacterium SW_11_45_7]